MEFNFPVSRNIDRKENYLYIDLVHSNRLNVVDKLIRFRKKVKVAYVIFQCVCVGGGFVIEKAPHPMTLAGIDILLYEIMFMHEFSILNIITLQSLPLESGDGRV